MRTGEVESWSQSPETLGPIYPFVGAEMLFFIICLLILMIFLAWKFRMERRKYDRAVELHRNGQMK